MDTNNSAADKDWLGSTFVVLQGTPGDGMADAINVLPPKTPPSDKQGADSESASQADDYVLVNSDCAADGTQLAVDLSGRL